MPLALTHAQRTLLPSRKTLSFRPHEPFPGAWLKAGDLVEVLFEGYWYYGAIGVVTAHGYYNCMYPDGSESVVESNYVRRPQPYHEGQHIEVLIDGYYHECEIVEQFEDGTFHLVFDNTDGRSYYEHDVETFRRRGYATSKQAYVAAY
jgi:hypothetical protein